MLRKQSRESHGLNSLGTPTVTSDPVNNDTPAKVIASFSDLGTSANIVEHEIHLQDMKSTSSLNSMRMFTAKNIAGDTGYTYEIEIEVEDQAVKFFAIKLDKMYSLLKELNLYYIEATKASTHIDPGTGDPRLKNNFNIYLNKFSNTFIAKNTKTTNNNSAISEYIKNDFISLLKMAGSTSSNITSEKILNLIRPATGSPAGISKVIKIVENIIKRVSELAGVSSYNLSGLGIGAKAVKQDITSNVGIQNKSKDQKSLFKVIIPLNSKTSFKGDMDVGYDFLSTSKQAAMAKNNSPTHYSTGFKILTSENFMIRVGEEGQKYYSSSGFNDSVNNDITSGDILGNTAMSFLTPSRVRVGDTSENIISKSVNPSEKEKMDYRNIFLKSIMYNLNDKFFSPPSTTGPGTQDSALGKDNDNKNLLLKMFSSSGVSLIEKNKVFGLTNLVIDRADEDNSIAEPIQVGTPRGYNGTDFTHLKNPNSLLFVLLSKFSDILRNKKPLEYYDLSKLISAPNGPSTVNHGSMLFSKGHIYEAMVGKFIVADKVADKLKKIPNQIKALLRGSSLVFGSAGFYEGQLNIIKVGYFSDPLKDPKVQLQDYPHYWYHFDNIVEVQYLSGYKTTEFDTHINMPTWKRLDLDSHEELSGNKILCRLHRYEDTMLDISRAEILELPIYNEYFILDLEE